MRPTRKQNQVFSETLKGSFVLSLIVAGLTVVVAPGAAGAVLMAGILISFVLAALAARSAGGRPVTLTIRRRRNPNAYRGGVASSSHPGDRDRVSRVILAVVVSMSLTYGVGYVLVAESLVGLLVALFLVAVAVVAGILWYRYEARLKEERRLAEEESERKREELRRWIDEQDRKSEEEHRQRIEAMLHRDAVRDEINYMSGPEFEKFMADVFRQKGYDVEETPLSGDQGIDLLLPDYDGKRVVIQLKRWTGPVGNAAVQATFAGMAHYQATEGWIITTSTFTKSARELARSTRVRLIDGKELADWLEGLREED